MSEPAPACRFCGAALNHIVLDLGEQPLANAFLKEADLFRAEPKYRLCVRVCDECLLVQTDTTVPPETIFSDYVYFSSYSNAWLAHAKAYSEAMIARFGLGSQSRVIEAASNDGYLLKNFVVRGIPCLGIEPAENVAQVARAAGVPTEAVFLGEETARRIVASGGPANLVAANNVLAHVPAINDFVAGLRALLTDDGVLTVECPHLVRLIAGVQFDTIYHEHFFYFSLTAIERIFSRHGLRLFDVEQLSTHGGSLRIFAERADAKNPRAQTGRLQALRDSERDLGVLRSDYYDGFNRRVTATIESVRRFLADARRDSRTVVAYGAAAKGNTLLNACGATNAEIVYAVDRNPHKQGLFLPGTHVPVYAPERIAETKPDYVLILPWNLRDEIVQQTKDIASWGGKFAIPNSRTSGVRGVRLTPTKIPGALVLEIEPLRDERGFFARTYCFETLRAAGASFGAIRQTSLSFNAQKGTLRGMHWQAEPKPEGKIVRASSGRIFDAIVDLRQDSPAYLDWFGLELDAARHNALLIPPGCAHGFLTLEDDCAVDYVMDTDYVAGLARGCRWNDPAFGIAWPTTPSAMSERDRNWPDFVR